MLASVFVGEIDSWVENKCQLGNIENRSLECSQKETFVQNFSESVT